jgi:hypothetical protein
VWACGLALRAWDSLEARVVAEELRGGELQAGAGDLFRLGYYDCRRSESAVPRARAAAGPGLVTRLGRPAPSTQNPPEGPLWFGRFKL